MSLWKALTGYWSKGGSTGYDKIRIDGSTNSLQIVDYEHHEIHSGSHYFIVGYQTLASGNVLQFTWQTPNTTKWIHWTWDIDVEAETIWQVYEGGTINSALANAVTPYNSNRNSANTSGTTMRFELHGNLAAADADVDVSGATLLGTGVAGSGRKIGGNAMRSNELMMKQNTLYVLRAVEVDPGYINFNMQWYEHTDKH